MSITYMNAHKTAHLPSRNRSLKIKLGDLQSKVVELTKAQKEYQECVSKAEETKKYVKKLPAINLERMTHFNSCMVITVIG